MNAWKAKAEITAGIRRTVAEFLRRARRDSREAARELGRYRGGDHYAHDRYLRYLASRSDWVHAARILLANTTRRPNSAVQERLYARALVGRTTAL